MLDRNQYQKYVSLALMILISMGGQVLSVVKTSIIAGMFGATAQMDAYNFANSFITFSFGFIAVAIPTVVMPNYVKDDDDKRAVNGFIAVIYGIVLGVMAILLVLRYQVVMLLSNRDEGYISLVCNILCVLLLVQSANSITYVTAAFFQSKGLYNIPKIIQLLTQIVTVCVLLMCRGLNIMQYTCLIAAGTAAGFLIDLYIAIKKGWRFYIPKYFWKNQETIDLLKLFFPVVFSTGAYQLSLMIDSLIAERLEEGMITILTYSSQISSIVNGVIVGNLQLYIYPRIIRNIKSNQPQALFWKQTEAMHCIMWLIIAGFIIVGREGISVLFERDAFQKESADAVYIGTAIYIFGQQTNIVRDLLYKYFYAKGDTQTPSFNSIMVSVSNIVLSLILIYFIGFYGIILGTICASFISLVVIMTLFSRKFGLGLPLVKIIGPYIKNALIGLTTIAALMWVKSMLNISMDVVAILVYGLGTVALYLLIHGIFNKGIREALHAL